MRIFLTEGAVTILSVAALLTVKGVFNLDDVSLMVGVIFGAVFGVFIFAGVEGL